MTIADARAIMFAIHRKRAESGNQRIERRLERDIASDAAMVDHELERIERATELDSAIDLDGLARDILERSEQE